MKPQISLLILTVLVLASCKTEIEYKGEITEPQMVVFCDMTAHYKPQVSVSRSTFFLDNTKALPDSDTYRAYLLKDAQVSYSVNGGDWIEMSYVEPKEKYEPTAGEAIYPQSSDTITLRVSHKDYEEAIAVQVVPEELVTEMTDVKMSEQRNNKGDTICTYTITYHISPTKDKSVIGRMELKDSYLQDLPIKSNDMLFQELSDVQGEGWRGMVEGMVSLGIEGEEDYRKYLDFRMSDIPEEGRDVVVQTAVTPAYVNGKKERTLRGVVTDWTTYSSDTYLYMQSIAKYKGSNTRILGMEEKVQVFGNFSGKTLGCFTVKAKIGYIVTFIYE